MDALGVLAASTVFPRHSVLFDARLSFTGLKIHRGTIRISPARELLMFCICGRLFCKHSRNVKGNGARGSGK